MQESSSMPAPLRFVSYYRIVLRIGKIFGLPLPWSNETQNERILHLFWQAAVEVFFLYKVICSVLAFKVYPSFEELVFGTATAMFQCFGFLLNLFYAVRRTRLEKIIDKMDSLSRHIAASGLDMKEFYEETYTKDAKNITTFARLLTPFSVITPLVFCTSVPILALLDGTYGERLPVYNGCPYETTEPAFYEYLIVQGFIAYMMLTVQKLGHECVMLGLFRIQSAYFKALSRGISHLSKHQNINSPIINNQLKVWIRLHQDVIRNANDLVDFFSPVIVLYYICIIGIVGGAAYYQLNAKNVNVFQSNFVGMYLIVTMLYMYLQCHVGDEVTTEAGSLAESVYSMPWYEPNSQVRRFIQMIISRANRPITVMSFKCDKFRLSREAYQAFVTNTISAYMAFSKVTGISE